MLNWREKQGDNDRKNTGK